MLAVVIRELRAEARHPFTYWLRVLGASAMVLTAVYGLLQSASPRVAGALLFARLHLCLYCSIWVLVPLIAADCISRERREGTLPLLFLTPLSAQGIVLAKALAHGLRAVTLCLAVLPVMAIPILMGGVSWQEAFVSLAFNFSAFCWALAAGLLASAWCKSWSRALTVAMLLANILAMVFGCIFMVTAAALVTRCLPPGFKTDMAIRNVFEALGTAAYGGFFWKYSLATIAKPAQTGLLLSAAVTSVVSALVLVVAIMLAAQVVSRRWQELPASARQEKLQRMFCTPRFWVKWFRRWMQWKLNRNPIGWLEQRTWSSRLISWSWLAVLISLNSLALQDFSMYQNAFHQLQAALATMLAGNLALSAAGSLRRERESGLLELLLVTPLTPGQIVGGRLRALWGQFLLASMLLVGVWLYFRRGFGDWTGEGAILTYVGTFATLPMIGLYFSLKRTHFMTALIWTISCGALPLLVGQLNERFDIVGPMATAVFCYLALILSLVGLAIYGFRRGQNAGAIFAGVLAAAVTVHALFIFNSFSQSLGGVPWVPPLFKASGQLRPSLISALLQGVLAIVLGFKLHRDLARRNFRFQAAQG